MPRATTKRSQRAKGQAKVKAAKPETVDAGADAAALRSLAAAAKRVNAALDKARVAEGRADDLRVTAAVELAAAKTMCAENKVNFKSWCEANVTQGYAEVTRLVKIGQSDDPHQAIEDMRSRNREKNKEHRARKKVGATKSISASPAAAAETAIEQMPVKKRQKFIEERAESLGMVIIPKDQAPPSDPLGAAQFAFEALGAKDKTNFLKWLTTVMDVDVTYGGVSLSG